MQARAIAEAPASVIERVRAKTYGQAGRDSLDRLAQLAEPGTRLWILPFYGQDGYRGLGEAGTALGLAESPVEALFGGGGNSLLLHYRTDSGQEGTMSVTIALTEAEAAVRWWVTDGRGNLVTGGHPGRDRMARLAEDHGGVLQQGLAASTALTDAAEIERITAWLRDPATAALVPVWNTETDETLWVPRAEAAAGMLRYARALGPGSAACGEAERRALAMLRGKDG
jgi:hypothetical protein